MNRDIRLSVDFLGHHKVRRLKRLHGAEGVLCLIALYLYTAKHRPLGQLSGMDAADIADACGWTGDGEAFVADICEIGFLERCDEGVYQIHDWADHNPWVAGAEDRQAKAQFAAKSRWSKGSRLSTEAPGQCSEDAPVCSGQCSSDAPLPSPSPKGIKRLPSETKSLFGESLVVGGTDDPPQPRSAPCPAQQILDLYNALLSDQGLPEAKVLGKVLQGQIRARWREDRERRNLDWWRAYFERVGACDWLMGRVDGRGGSFRASLNWLTGAQNMGKVLNGQYDQRCDSPRGHDRRAELEMRDTIARDILKERNAGACGENKTHA